MVNNKVFWAEELLRTNPNWTENESCYNYCNMYNAVSEEILFINPNSTKSKSYSDMHNVIVKEIPFMKKI